MQEVVGRLRRESEPLCRDAGVEKIILFGSYATGRQTAASDIDLLVIIDTTVCDKDRAYRILRKGMSLKMVELHILSKEEYQAMKETRWVKTIEKEGKTIISTTPQNDLSKPVSDAQPNP